MRLGVIDATQHLAISIKVLDMQTLEGQELVNIWVDAG